MTVHFFSGHDPVLADTEKALLGSAMIDAAFADEMLLRLKSNHFSLVAHQAIFDAIAAVRTDGAHLDVASVARVLRDHGRLQAVGGVSALAHAISVSAYTDIANVGYHAKTLISAYKRRLQADIADRTRQAANDLSVTDDEFFDGVRSAQHALDDENGQSVADRPRQAYDVAVDYMQHLSDLWEGKATSSISTGLEGLDAIAGGMSEKELIVLAADSGCGKSTLAIQIAAHVAAQGHGVVFFGLEMSQNEVMRSIVASRADVSIDALSGRTGVTARDHTQIVGALNNVSQWPLFIYDGASLTLADVRAHVRKIVVGASKAAVKLVVLDYLRLFDLGAADNEELAISAFTRGCKELAKEFGVTVLLCAQLNRDVKKNQGGRPTMRDLKGSSSIENNANKVWLIYRQFLALPNKMSENARLIEDMAEIVVDKNRSGKIGSCKVKFEGAFARFSTASENDLTRWISAFEMKDRQK